MDISNIITNWKLKEIINDIIVVSDDSTEYKYFVMNKLNLPMCSDDTFHRSQTDIDWSKMTEHYEFYFDRIGWEDKIKAAFESSELKYSKKIIIPYGWKEPAVVIPTKLFFEDWEGFLSSVYYQTVIFSEDYKLIMEVSRDYHLHSNFRILQD